ncbi:hypothetical protein NKR23_g12516 [Pleurostoma richardsiae]|uniref:Uncharacterized protein n=1 Tax=Pleurostoma richardsiae TaxID=41990 RepID=A0AA38R5L7_9PEZI|nr:hypothetical protein NKR23_g12516 [Pleurostoma richardsiae]
MTGLVWSGICIEDPLLRLQAGQRARRHYLLTLLSIFFSMPTRSLFRCLVMFLVSVFLTAVQFVALPPLLERVPEKQALWVAFGLPIALEQATDGAWILITVELDTHLHNSLIGAKLNHKQRDALRKCISLDTAIRIFITKILIAVVSLTLAFRPAMGTPLALVASPTLVAVNQLSRRLMGQEKALDEYWERRVQRNRSFDECNSSSGRLEFEKSGGVLRRSQIWREVSDKVRAGMWTIFLFSVCYYTSNNLRTSIKGKIIKDAMTLDSHLDKLSKSWVPAKTLMETYDDVQRGRSDLEAGLRGPPDGSV